MDGFKLLSKHRKSIMGLAGIFVLLFHCWDLRFGAIPVIGPIESFVKTNGFYGVDIFLFMSGYGLFYSMEKGKLGQYYAHRLIKLFPPFIIMAAIYCAIYSKGFMFFIKAVSGYGFYFESLYFFLWYVTGIITISLIFPLYYYLMKKFDNDVIFTLLMITIWFVVTMLLRNGTRTDLCGFTNRLPIFMLGTLAGSLSKRKSFSFDWKVWVTLFVVFLAGMYCVDLFMNKGVEFIVPMSGCFIPPVLMMVPFTFLFAGLCEVCQNGHFIPGFFKGLDKVLSFIGGITLELYCVQEILLSQLRIHFFGDIGILTRNILSVLAAILAAFIMFLILNCYKYIGKNNKGKRK